MMEAAYREHKKPVILNTISLMWFTIAAVIFLWGFTFVDQSMALAVKCLGAVAMGLVGIVMAGLTVGIKWDVRSSITAMGQTIYLLGIACFATMLINALTQKFAKFETLPMPRSLFSVLLGNMEEVFFRGWLQSFLLVFTGSLFLAVIISSGCFGVFHGAVYGLDPVGILVVTLVSFLLGFVFHMGERQLHITQTAHGVVNLLSYLGGKG